MASSGRNSNRDNRGAGGNRDNRGSGGNRDNRGSGGNRDNRGSGGNRDSRGAGGNRDNRGSGGNRDSRGSGGNRDSRGSSGNRDNRGSGGNRDNRGSGGNRDNRGPGGDRDRGRPSGQPRPEDRRHPGHGAKPGGSRKRAAGSRSTPARPREYEAQLEERNRQRHGGGPRTPKTFGEQDGVRLQKVLARAGMGSRRACEELVERRRVEVNGKIVTEQGLRVVPGQDEIKVDGLTVATQSDLFFALNKPSGVVSAMEDPEGRQNLGDYVQNREARLFHVGRLDTETEGLILLTNHGELAHRLTHPRYGVRKTYLAAIEVTGGNGRLPRDLGQRLRDGVRLDDGFARADAFRVVENNGRHHLVEISLHEGRKHIVRRMLAETGFPVGKLVRTGFGPIALGDQKSGWLRRMTNTEVGQLMREVDL